MHVSEQWRDSNSNTGTTYCHRQMPGTPDTPAIHEGHENMFASVTSLVVTIEVAQYHPYCIIVCMRSIVTEVCCYIELLSRILLQV
jgi:hypothetical protein